MHIHTDIDKCRERETYIERIGEQQRIPWKGDQVEQVEQDEDLEEIFGIKRSRDLKRKR